MNTFTYIPTSERPSLRALTTNFLKEKIHGELKRNPTITENQISELIDSKWTEEWYEETNIFKYHRTHYRKLASKMLIKRDGAEHMRYKTPTVLRKIKNQEPVSFHQDSSIRCYNVYMAGKIAYYDWRHLIFKDLSEEYHDIDYRMKHYTMKFVNGFHYNGPYFLKDDHGSFHGDYSHGLGANQDGYYASTPNEIVYEHCIRCIKSSHAIFVYIESSDAFGTFYEIGHAKALNKPVFLTFNTKTLTKEKIKDMWFLREAADYSLEVTDVETAWNSFVSWFYKKNSLPKSYEGERPNPQASHNAKMQETATEKQISYLISLLNQKRYILKDEYVDTLSKGQAGSLISCLTANKPIHEDLMELIDFSAFKYTKAEVVKEIKSKLKGKKFDTALLDYTIEKLDVINNTEYMGGYPLRYTQEWVDFLKDKFRLKRDYTAFFKDFNKKKEEV